MALKVSERLTFREARYRYNATHPKRSYARVARTAAPTQPVQQPPTQNNITQLIALLRSFGLQVVSAPSVNAGQLRQPAPSTRRNCHHSDIPVGTLRRPADQIVIAAGPWSSVPRNEETSRTPGAVAPCSASTRGRGGPGGDPPQRGEAGALPPGGKLKGDQTLGGIRSRVGPDRCP